MVVDTPKDRLELAEKIGAIPIDNAGPERGHQAVQRQGLQPLPQQADREGPDAPAGVRSTAGTPREGIMVGLIHWIAAARRA